MVPVVNVAKFIKVTNASTKHTFTISAQVIWLAERMVDNPLQTLLFTTMSGPKGIQVYPVLESPEEIYRLLEGVEPESPPANLLAGKIRSIS